jgi:hypothetical protein
MRQLIDTTLVMLRARWRQAGAEDTGATAIEWAIFAILAITIAGLVAAAITLAINNRLPSIT